MKITKAMGLPILAAVLAIGLGPVQRGYASDDGTTQSDDSASGSSASGSALQQLEDAAKDGQEAVEAPTDEDAKTESNETIDTPHDSDGN
jgi:hypothetical protein